MLFNLVFCKGALLRLNDYMDAELSPREMLAVRRHLKLCRACRRKFQVEAGVLEEMRAKLNTFSVPDNLRQKIADLLETGQE